MRRCRVALVTILLAAVCLAGCQSPVPAPTGLPSPGFTPCAYCAEARVVSVVDGDTIRVDLDGAVRSVRYIGIDTPESAQPGYKTATDVNRRLVTGQTVWLEKDTSDTDVHGRLLRYVWLADGRMVNEEIVRAGVAQAARYWPDVRYQPRLEAAATEAWRAKAGFWQGGADAFSYGAVTADSVRIRRCPNGNDVNGKAAFGKIVAVYGRNQAGDWVQVRGPDRTGGWVEASALEITIAVSKIPFQDPGVDCR